VHELLAALSFLAEGNTPQVPNSDTSSYKIAIITTIGVIIAAAITAAATTIQRRRDVPTDGTQDLIAELQRRAATAEAKVSDLAAKEDSLAYRVDELEGYCWQNGIDPRDGKPVARPGPSGRGNDGQAPTH
jgi:hypothetical protein